MGCKPLFVCQRAEYMEHKNNTTKQQKKNLCLYFFWSGYFPVVFVCVCALKLEKYRNPGAKKGDSLVGLLARSPTPSPFPSVKCAMHTNNKLIFYVVIFGMPKRNKRKKV